MRSSGCVLVVSLALGACLSSADLSGGDKKPGAADGGTASCSADLSTDIGNCGACGHVCPNNANAYGTCTGGKCAIGCNTGFADCDGNAANGCEVVLATDATNCGACGHSCNGAECSAGACGGIVLTTFESQITGIALDGTDLFCGLFDASGPTGSIVRIGTDGQNRLDLVEGLTSGPRNFALDADSIYFGRLNTAPYTSPPNGAILRASRSTPSTTPETVVANEAVNDNSGAHSIQVSGGAVDWLTTSYATEVGTNIQIVNPKIRGASMATLPATAADIFAPDGSLTSFLVDGVDLYFSAFGDADTFKTGTYHCPVSGCGSSPTLLPTPGATTFSLLVGTPSTLFLGNSGAIDRMEKPGINYELFATTRGGLVQMVSDGKDLFWTDTQVLFSCPVDGCTAPPSGVDLHANPIGLALTADAVYVAVSAGSNGVILKVVR